MPGIVFDFLSKPGDVNVMPALYKGLTAAGVLALIAFYPITLILMEDVLKSVPFEVWGRSRTITVWHLYGAAVVGMVLTAIDQHLPPNRPALLPPR